ncbi:MAG: Rieske 2Fe-2S domain-containing protein [Actinomycetota bacterium]|nr:Rieske 2Fe-2S domain-containing protein [Actinomycetota bacterium]
MTATTIFIIAVVGAGVLALLGVFAIAYRRGPSAPPATAPELDKEARKVDRSVQRTREAAATPSGITEDTGAVATLPDTDTQTETAIERPPPADPATERTEITQAEYGITRRKFFNRALFAVFALFLAQFALTGLAFFWPKLKGGFGSKVNAGKVEDLKAEVFDGATIIPVHDNPAQAWIVPFDMSELPGSSYEGVPFVVAGGEGDGIGLMAMWQRCVHLGCKVPECVPSQGFECPCHGSKYNIHGEYSAGPAPRNLDRFAVEVNGAGELIIDTGTIVETPRSKKLTAAYPQGPFCV